jgi:hypothetical protein
MNMLVLVIGYGYGADKVGNPWKKISTRRDRTADEVRKSCREW